MKKIINIPKEKLKILYENEKLSAAKIAKIYGRDDWTILKKLHKFNIKVRPGKSQLINLPLEKLIELYTQKKLSIYKIAKKFRCSPWTVWIRLKKAGVKLRDAVDSHIKYPKNSFDGDPIEKAYLIGFALGDLKVEKPRKNGRTIVVGCGTTKVEQINLIKRLFKKYGHIQVCKPDEKGRKYVEALLDLSFSFLLEPMKEIKWIEKENKYFDAFLAGFVDAEGSIFFTSGRPRFALGNYNKKILLLIKKKLAERGINLLGPYKHHPLRPRFLRLLLIKKSTLLQLFSIIEQHLKHEKRIKDLKAAKKFYSK